MKRRITKIKIYKTVMTVELNALSCNTNTFPSIAIQRKPAKKKKWRIDCNECRDKWENRRQTADGENFGEIPVPTVLVAVSHVSFRLGDLDKTEKNDTLNVRHCEFYSFRHYDRQSNFRANFRRY